MGGAEVFTREVARRWVDWGHEVTLFAAEFPGCLKEEFDGGVRIVRAGGRFSVYRWAGKLYERRFAQEHFDVVVDEINTRPFFAQKFVKSGAVVVALIHQLAREYWFYETPFPVSYIGYHYLENRWLRNYATVPTVTVSESTKQDLVGLGFEKVFVVPEGLNFEPLKAIPQKERFPAVMYAGRLKRAKRPDHAIRAFKIVKEKVPEAELWIVGDGPFRDSLDKISCEGIRFLGNLPNNERRERLKKAWVLVNPSIREGWGLNIIEANALGVPAVAYDVAGLRDSVKDGNTGLLAEAGNVEALAQKIALVLRDKGMRMQLSEDALEYSRGFSWDRTAHEFLGILGDCL